MVIYFVLLSNVSNVGFENGHICHFGTLHNILFLSFRYAAMLSQLWGIFSTDHLKNLVDHLYIRGSSSAIRQALLSILHSCGLHYYWWTSNMSCGWFAIKLLSIFLYSLKQEKYTMFPDGANIIIVKWARHRNNGINSQRGRD